MNLSEYQALARSSAIYPRQCAVEYCTLGLASEAGEVAGKVKKVLRDHQGDFPGHQWQIASELGDVLWYVAQLATELGLGLDEIAELNLAKLADRKERGVIGGSGDKR